MDFAGAHVAAINRLFIKSEKPQVAIGDPISSTFEVFNIGTVTEYSVLEVIVAFEAANDEKVSHEVGPCRSGNIVAVWAETTKVTNVLRWSATRNLETMMRDTWNWQLAKGK